MASHRAVLGVLPMLAAAVLTVGAQTVGLLSGNAGAATGVLDARAELLPAPAANQMMMPMDAGMQHSDEVQVTLALRNDSDAEVTVPFDRVAMLAADGSRVEATGGLVGDLVLRPHAAAEERLRFPAPEAGAEVFHLAVPEGSSERTLDLPLRGAALPTTPVTGHAGHGT
jgi:hypothetical protein